MPCPITQLTMEQHHTTTIQRILIILTITIVQSRVIMEPIRPKIIKSIINHIPTLILLILIILIPHMCMITTKPQIIPEKSTKMIMCISIRQNKTKHIHKIIKLITITRHTITTNHILSTTRPIIIKQRITP